MKKIHRFFIVLLAFFLPFASANAQDTITITDIHGEVEVPKNPERVVSLDNRTFETLDQWGVKLLAAPKGLIPQEISYATDDAIEDIGNHREPNLEVIAAVEPDLVIVGQRFAKYYDDIKALVPDAAVIDLNIDLETPVDGNYGQTLVDGLKTPVQQLGEIFDKKAEADALVSDFEASVQAATDAYNGEDTVMGVIVSGGDVGYSAPITGRVWGPLFDLFAWKPALEVEGATSDHQGDDISVEAIAESNPAWLMVLDRDAAANEGEEAITAVEVIESSQALNTTDAVQKGQIVYAPLDTYTNESIQTFTELFQSIADAMKD